PPARPWLQPRGPLPAVPRLPPRPHLRLPVRERAPGLRPAGARHGARAGAPAFRRGPAGDRPAARRAPGGHRADRAADRPAGHHRELGLAPAHADDHRLPLHPALSGIPRRGARLPAAGALPRAAAARGASPVPGAAPGRAAAFRAARLVRGGRRLPGRGAGYRQPALPGVLQAPGLRGDRRGGAGADPRARLLPSQPAGGEAGERLAGRCENGRGPVLASSAMSYPGRLLVVFVSFVLASGALAQARLDLRIEPPNAELKRNIEGHVGSLDADDEEQLQRLSRVVEAQARRAGEALGYYQARITSEV